ncbi:MAG: cbb3-type cytochrome c oxidase subunit II, partial [Gammaproteobacteria bacterium]|nr:cbb3-type cytochrome c oxidase subunit II [Gammaproteobacteria bacterium]
VWHRVHLIDPRSVVENSIMPAYPWLADRAANADDDIQLKLKVLRRLGHPYTDEEIASAPEKLNGLSELDALVAYLQVLGTYRSSDDDSHGAAH